MGFEPDRRQAHTSHKAGAPLAPPNPHRITLLIHGSQQSLVCTYSGVVTIGCQTHPLSYWLEHYRALARQFRAEFDDTEKSIAEYKLYLDTCVAWLELQQPKGESHG